MTRNRRVRRQKRVIGLLTVAVVLLVALLAIVLVQQELRSRAPTNDAPAKSAVVADEDDESRVSVELGVYGYMFDAGRATKLEDDSTRSLQSFLVNAAQREVSDNCQKAYYWVMAHNEQRNQVLLNYGCENPGSRMFAVRDDQGWRFLSPTNQFDMFGVPACEHVEENMIDVAIAPACYVASGETGVAHRYIGR